MIVHLESGIAAAAREAHHMVLAVIYCDGRLVDGDVICPHIEDDTYFSLILQVNERKKNARNYTNDKKMLKIFYTKL